MAAQSKLKPGPKPGWVNQIRAERDEYKRLYYLAREETRHEARYAQSLQGRLDAFNAMPRLMRIWSIIVGWKV